MIFLPRVILLALVLAGCTQSIPLETPEQVDQPVPSKMALASAAGRTPRTAVQVASPDRSESLILKLEHVGDFEFGELSEGIPDLPRDLHRYVANLISELIVAGNFKLSTPSLHIHDCPTLADRAYLPNTLRICLGTIQNVETIDELAFVIGHELSHLALGHMADDAEFRLRQMRSFTPLAFGFPFAALEEKSARERKEMITKKRPQEIEADYAAVDLLARNNLSPNGALRLVELMRKSKRIGTTWHEERQSRRSQKWQRGTTFVFQSIVADAVGTAADKIVPASIHPFVDHRAQLLKSYIARHHQDALAKPLKKLPWLSDSPATGEFAAAREYVKALKISQRTFFSILESVHLKTLEPSSATRTPAFRVLETLLDGALRTHSKTRLRVVTLCIVSRDAECLNKALESVRGQTQYGLGMHLLAAAPLPGRTAEKRQEAIKHLRNAYDALTRDHQVEPFSLGQMALAFKLLGDSNASSTFQSRCRQAMAQYLTNPDGIRSSQDYFCNPDAIARARYNYTGGDVTPIMEAIALEHQNMPNLLLN